MFRIYQLYNFIHGHSNNYDEKVGYLLLIFDGPKEKSFMIGGPSQWMTNNNDNSKVIYLPKAVKLLRKEHLPAKMVWADDVYTLGGQALPHPKLWGIETFGPNEDSDFGAPATIVTFQEASPTKKARKE
jgi:hypothetical protein